VTGRRLTPAPGEALVVMYHYVRDPDRTPYPALKTLRVEDFDRQLQWLAASWAPVPYERFRGAGRPEAAALLTFDDGLVDHYATVFPRLRDRGWSGVFFVAGGALADTPSLLNVHRTQFLLAALGAEAFSREVRAAVARAGAGEPALEWHRDVYRYDQSPDLAAKHLLNYELPIEAADEILRTLVVRHLGDETEFARGLYLSRAQVREMAAGGMTFGFHTERHPVLSRLARDAQRREVEDGVALLRQLTGQQAIPFCYPYGHPHTYNSDTFAALDDAGYDLAFTTTRRLARPGEDPRFEIPRFDTRDLPPFVEL
jgi:peptidoglycan/xylan/chitin deacetylase (PgdA/CDA1 family)